ncbi:hypothetical protein D3C78_1803100 [compost metagenome]
MRAPAPAQIVGLQVLLLLVQDGQRGGRRRVIAIKRRIANVVDQRVGNAQHRDKVVNATVLRESSAHGPISGWSFQLSRWRSDR